MANIMVIQGRRLDESDMRMIRGLLDAHPDWHRTQLSGELCARWDWHNAQGRPKDMAARTLLLKLERAGHIRLPPRRSPSPNPGWVQVPHLASHVLGLIARRIRADWQAKYGHPVHALETFVDRSRFKGTCYRAANWQRMGEPRGRTRNDREHRIQAPVKDVYLYPLVKDFKEALRHDHA